LSKFKIHSLFIKKILYFVLIFAAASLCFAMYFGYEIYTNELRNRTRPVPDSSEVLPLTNALQAPEKPEDQLLLRPDFNVLETRSHRYLRDRYMGFRNYKNFRGQMLMKAGDQVVYDVKISTDEHGRRCNNDDCKRPKKECGQMLVFASSKIFGYGVKNNETLPAQLAEQFPEFSVYNYGLVAGNYFHLLVPLKSGELKNSLDNLPTMALFFWEHDGFSRTYPKIGNPHILEQPCFVKNTETQAMEFKGNLMSCQPFKSQLIWYLSLSKTLQKYFPNIDFTSSSEKVEDVRNIFTEIKRELNRQFPKSIFVLGAIEHNENDHNIKELMHISETLDIPVISFNVKEAKLKFKAEGKQVDAEPYEKHPSAFLYQYIAEQMRPSITDIFKQVVSDENCFESRKK
jgi:hypothetical protein